MPDLTMTRVDLIDAPRPRNRASAYDCSIESSLGERDHGANGEYTR